MSLVYEIIGIVVVLSLSISSAAWAVDKAVSQALLEACVLGEFKAFMAKRGRHAGDPIWRRLRARAICAAVIVAVAVSLAVWVL